MGIYLMVEDVVDDGVHVGDVYLTVAVDIAGDGPAFTMRTWCAGVTATAATVDDDVDDLIDVGDINLAVTIYVPKHIEDCIPLD